MNGVSSAQQIIFHSKMTGEKTVIKFVCNKIISSGGAKTFNNAAEASSSPLIQRLLGVTFIKRVLVIANLIVIEQDGSIDWEVEQHELLKVIQKYFLQHESLWLETDTSITANKEAIDVYVEQTPNPRVMKFACNRLLFSGLLEFENRQQAAHSPLALLLFDKECVEQVFISENYISITKKETFDWIEIQYMLRDNISKELKEGIQILDTPLLKTEEEQPLSAQIETREFQGIEKEIADILEEQISPAVALDGGHISLEFYNSDTREVTVKLHGACSGCPSSTVTLKEGIEKLLKSVMPHKVNAVVALN